MMFSGAGVTSTGVERARLAGKKCAKVVACVNHDAKAIASHAANHPEALHLTDADMQALIELLGQVKGKFMLTMFPYQAIEEAANRSGWVIYRVERTISASKENRRKQEEWIVCNYSKSDANGQKELFI